MMKMTTLTACLALASAVSVLAAQSSETVTKTKIDVKDGKDVKVTGCIEAGTDGGYLLTNVADKTGERHSYVLVGSENFSKVLHNRVEIDGKIADSRDGKVEIKTETKVDGPAKDTHAKVEMKAAFLGVQKMRSIASVCP